MYSFREDGCTRNWHIKWNKPNSVRQMSYFLLYLYIIYIIQSIISKQNMRIEETLMGTERDGKGDERKMGQYNQSILDKNVII